jgi:DNA ligase-1
MSKDGEPEVTFHVFDVWDRPEIPFHERDPAKCGLDCFGAPIRFLTQTLINDQEELDRYEAWALTEGYEGVMVRDPEGLYKFGRATARGGELTKIKRFVDGEAVVVGVEERMHNENPAEEDELGNTKRSTHQENMVPAGDLGSFVCCTPDGVRFGVGTGLTSTQRKALWEDRHNLVGKWIKFKHFAQVGVVNAPRFPVFLGWRHPDDMGSP